MTLFSEKCLFPIDANAVSCPTQSKNLGWYLLSIHGNRDTQRVMTHIAMQAWNILRNKMNQSNQS